MVQPNGPGITHRRPQHAAKWLELPLFETDRIESGQAPVLPGCVEGVRRRADRQTRQDRILIAPGVEAITANADRNVEIESDRQAARAGSRTTAVELLVGHPLHKFDEANVRWLRAAKPIEGFLFRFTPLLRPFPPRMSEFPAQPLEAAKTSEGGTVGLSKRIEGAMPFGAAFPTKHVVRKRKRTHLRLRHALVIDDVLFSKAFDRVLQTGRVRAGKFRNRIHVDVERVEKEAAVRGIWARVLGPIIEQGVQRVEPDSRGTQIGGNVNQGGKIAEVAMPPIAPRPNSVKLHRERPHPTRSGPISLIRAIPTNDQADRSEERPRRTRDGDAQTEDAILRDRRQRQHGRYAFSLGNPPLRKDFPAQRQPLRDGEAQAEVG